MSSARWMCVELLRDLGAFFLDGFGVSRIRLSAEMTSSMPLMGQSDRFSLSRLRKLLPLGALGRVHILEHQTPRRVQDHGIIREPPISY